MIKQLLLALLTLSIAAPVSSITSKIYVWRNETGELVYSDTPKHGAEEITTKQGNVIRSSIDVQVLDINTQKTDSTYQVIIEQPKHNATIRDNTGSIYISATIQPIFKHGLTVQLILDDKPYQQSQTSAMFSLRNIDRGEHQIKMQLLNEKGKVIALSEAITFYMHRASVN